MYSKLLRATITIILVQTTSVLCAQELLYSWQSPMGTVEEIGGKLEHINQNGQDKRNVKCADLYTFVLNGDYRYINANYNVDECSYMKLTLNHNVFHEDDEIEITAMRDNVTDRPSSIYFLFHTTQQDSTGNGQTVCKEIDVPLIDTHVWNNLGKDKDGSVNGGTESRSNSYVSAQTDAFTPSTYTFIVPKEADGAAYLRLTRHQTGNFLYVSHLEVRRPEYSAIHCQQKPSDTNNKPTKRLIDNKIVVTYNGKSYNIDGTIYKK